jgi:hypothetical protein
MLLELGKAISFLASLLSLFPLLFSAFFVPGTHWEDRLLLSMDKAAMAAACCFVSGLFFVWSERRIAARLPSVFTTLPVRIYFLALGAMALLFVASWWLETYYMPLLWKNLPYRF